MTRKLEWLGCVCLLASAGCYSNVVIKPSELPKLNGGFSQTIAVGGNRSLIAISTTTVETPDGTLTQVNGQPDVTISETDGIARTFDAPVLSEATESGLAVRSANRAPVTIPWANIAKTEVRQFSSGKTWLVIGLSYVAAMVVTGGVLVGVYATRQ